MESIKGYLVKTFVTGYTSAEKVYLVSMLLLQVVVFCIAPETPLAIIAGIAGVISVVLCAKGKTAFYFIG